MPSGRTHDRITLWSLPAVAGLTFTVTGSGNLTLLVAGGFLFSGLMFGPDLDIHSRQFQRWGWLRWIWVPYQQTLQHRSVLSHGPIIGTLVRVLYLSGWIGVLFLLGWIASQVFWGVTLSWRQVGLAVFLTLQQYYRECFALLIGFELGAMSHSLSDWTGSAYKKIQRQGVRGWLKPASKTKKRETVGKNQRLRQKPRRKK